MGLGLFFGTLGSGLCDAAVCEGAFTEGFLPGADWITGSAVGAAGLLSSSVSAW